MINKSNYLQKIAAIDFSSLDKNTQEAKKVFDELTASGTDYSLYDLDSEIKESVDLYFDALSTVAIQVEQRSKRVQEKPRRTTKRKAKPTRSRKAKTGLAVEAFSEEFKFMKRYLNFHGKTKNRNHFRLFINALQKAIRDKKIRKTSKYAQEIIEIQNALIKAYNTLKNDRKQGVVELEVSFRNRLLSILDTQFEMPSIKLIKSYINLQGKLIQKLQAQRLLNRVNLAIDRGHVTKKDTYYAQIKSIRSKLKEFVKRQKSTGILQVENQTLNGLQLIVGQNESDPSPKHAKPEPLDIEKITEQYNQNKSKTDHLFIMNSMDFDKVEFKTVGLTKKWLNFFGDLAEGFRVLVKGFPKMGKSYFCVDFAGDLAASLGPVLYVSKEEGNSQTMRKKMVDTAAKHPNMTISNYIPENLEKYKFLFLDSVTKLKLSPENLDAINFTYPKLGVVEIHQVAKNGTARGNNEFAHDVDSLVDVYQKGKARQIGRHNDGGHIDIFNNHDSNAA